MICSIKAKKTIRFVDSSISSSFLPLVDYKKPFQELIAALQESARDEAALIGIREIDIVQNLLRLIKDISKYPEDFPNLQKKENIIIFLRLGALHTRVFQRLDRRLKAFSRNPEDAMSYYEEIRQAFQSSKEIFTLYNEVVRRRLFKKSAGEELCSRALAEIATLPFIFYDLAPFVPSVRAVVLLERKLISRLSYNEIADLFGAVMSSNTPSNDLYQLFKEKLRAKGLGLPQSSEEARILSKKLVHPSILKRVAE